MDLSEINDEQFIQMIKEIRKDGEILKKCLEDSVCEEDVTCIEHENCLEVQIKKNESSLNRSDMAEKNQKKVICCNAIPADSEDYQEINCIDHDKCLLAQYLRIKQEKCAKSLNELELEEFIGLDTRMGEEVEPQTSDEFPMIANGSPSQKSVAEPSSLEENAIEKNQILSNFTELLLDSKQYVKKLHCREDSRFYEILLILTILLMIFIFYTNFNQIYCASEFAGKVADKICARSWSDSIDLY